LKLSMIAHVKQMMGSNGYTEDSMPEAQIAGVVNENLDAACSVIKTAAMEKAAKDIDVNLTPQYAARKAHRDSRNQQPFWDGASLSVDITHQTLPDPLRLRNGLTTAQLRVYEDFSEPSRVLVNNDYAEFSDIRRVQTPGYEESIAPVLPAQTSLERFHELIAEVEKYVGAAEKRSLSMLPADHEIRSLIHNVVVVANQSANRDQTTLIISQKVVQFLYKSGSPLGREVYVLMLQQLCDLVPKVSKEVKQWLIYAEDTVSFMFHSS
jgi:CCR4-NOT transcription complex subunit 1